MIKVILSKDEIEVKNNFPKFVTLHRTGGLFIALSKTKFLCLNKGESGWSVGEIDDKDYFAWGSNGFVEMNDPITLQNA